MKPQLDERSAAYLSEQPDSDRVPLDLSESERARLAHLEGMVTTLLSEVEELKKRMDEKEGDGR